MKPSEFTYGNSARQLGNCTFIDTSSNTQEAPTLMFLQKQSFIPPALTLGPSLQTANHTIQTSLPFSLIAIYHKHLVFNPNKLLSTKFVVLLNNNSFWAFPPRGTLIVVNSYIVPGRQCSIFMLQLKERGKCWKYV